MFSLNSHTNLWRVFMKVTPGCRSLKTASSMFFWNCSNVYHSRKICDNVLKFHDFSAFLRTHFMFLLRKTLRSHAARTKKQEIDENGNENVCADFGFLWFCYENAHSITATLNDNSKRKLTFIVISPKNVSSWTTFPENVHALTKTQ